LAAAGLTLRFNAAAGRYGFLPPEAGPANTQSSDWLNADGALSLAKEIPKSGSNAAAIEEAAMFSLPLPSECRGIPACRRRQFEPERSIFRDL
jgi:hypothetical protein